MKMFNVDIPLEKVVHWILTLIIAGFSGAHIVENGHYVANNPYQSVLEDVASTEDSQLSDTLDKSKSN